MADKVNQQKIQDEFSWANSRLTTQMIPIIQKTYQDINLIDLLMNLPVKFKFDEVDVSKIPPTKNGKTVTEKDVALGGYITRDSEAGNPDRLVVFLTFTKDVNNTWENFFNTLVDDPHYANKLAFIYLHESLHILFRHYDFYLNATFEKIVTAIRHDLDQKAIAELLNHAFDYYINSYLIEQADPNSRIAEFREREKFNGLYDPNLSASVLQQSEIVEKLAREATVNQEKIQNLNGDTVGTITEITINGDTSTHISIDGGADRITQQPTPSNPSKKLGKFLIV
jgi:hypothetical protein